MEEEVETVDVKQLIDKWPQKPKDLKMHDPRKPSHWTSVTLDGMGRLLRSVFVHSRGAKLNVLVLSGNHTITDAGTEVLASAMQEVRGKGSARSELASERAGWDSRAVRAVCAGGNREGVRD